MALRLTVALTSLLFLFTFSIALSTLDQPEIQVTSNDRSSVDLPESNSKYEDAIVLPSEKPKSEPVFVEFQPEETDSKLHDPETVKTESTQEKQEVQTDSVPLTVITFRPINHHFDRRPFFPFRRGHNCHGRRHRFNHLNELRPGFGQRFDHRPRVSYGNDMVVSKDQDHGFDPVSYGGAHIGNRFNRHGWQLFNDEIKSEDLNSMPHDGRRSHHRRHHHHHHHDDSDEEGEEEEHKHEKERGIMKRIRKFLGHF